MIEIRRSRIFAEWLHNLRDPVGKARIVARIKSAEYGNFGDFDSVGNAIYEMRVHYGPGYRLYFTREHEVIYLLLVGGDKSTQTRDIRRAVQMAQKHR
ncbi:type II toxin-antitoxin system RelE/ParE family toxin [Pseudomonas sp. SZMC_28357]|uniref:type II toxin-antitoxin system RelE/ParE family toxin n=1 Tax=Pseudomonas sp. SZMC_28357 TaxID=3074380 RepID=UPI00287186BB|nr:type II toxin-antitoxin system RelE/ParE family toxin [Pseudomonas sp. SZMC_28357]MDR9752237.1 type II toxin-antitoxin system RelE/ParE family toxin [Pseudomonas sp. SZMC_28357]